LLTRQDFEKDEKEKKISVTLKRKTKVAKRGSNAESGAREVNADEREKRYLIEKAESKRSVSCG
jgi:hypothetical protein